VKQAVLLLAHGAPERVEDVEEYLKFVRGGRPGPTPPKVLEEVRQRLAAIGGSSPLRAWTAAQAAALEKLLGIPVFFGMRNWYPLIAQTMEKVRESGVERLAAVCMTPQFSEASVGLYIKRTEEAKQKLGMTAEIVGQELSRRTAAGGSLRGATAAARFGAGNRRAESPLHGA